MTKYPLFMGVDGGGTSCRARLTDAGGMLLGEGRSGPANPRLGAETAARAIMEAAGEAFAAAGLPLSACARTRAGIGLAGLGQAQQIETMQQWAHPFAAAVLSTDAQIACLGAHGGPGGGVVIVGTGSCGFSLVNNLPRQIGGRGFPISDAGSGAWIGLEALRHALEAHDGMAPRGILAEAVLDAVGGDPEGAVGWLDRATPRDYAALAPLTIEAAEQDATAARILRQAASAIARLIEAVRATKAEALYMLGGLAAPLASWLPSRQADFLSPPRGDALDGALLMIRRLSSAVSSH